MNKKIHIRPYITPLSCMALLAFCFPLLAWGHVNLVEVTPIALTHRQQTTVFTFIEEDNTHTTTLEITRRMGCLSGGNTLGKNTPEQFSAALTALSEKVTASEPFLFGFHALEIPKRRHAFWAVNLKLLTPSPDQTYIQSINTDVGTIHCPYLSPDQQ